MKVIIQLGPRILSAFRKKDQRALRKLNDEVLRATALECTKLNFSLAVFSYVLSKIVSKPRFLRSEYSHTLIGIANIFGDIVTRARANNEDEIMTLFLELEKAILALEKEDPRFLLNLVSKGKLKMAATFYAQGMSLGVASDMTGLEKQEILDYAGNTMMFDRVEEKITILERMKVARRFLSR